MTVTVTQRDRPGLEKGSRDGSELYYRAVTDTPADTPGIIRAAVIAAAPATLDGQALADVEVELQLRTTSEAYWFAEARYGGGSGFTYNPPERLAFNGSLADELIAQSLSVVESGTNGAGTATPAPDRDRLIRVNSEGKAEGTQVRRPVFTVRQNATMTDAELDTYVGNWLAAFGTVNGSTHLGYAAGTLLFQGLAAEPRDNGGYAVSFEYGYRPPETSLSIGDGMTIASLSGWDFLELSPKYNLDTVNGVIISEVDFYYVHRLYPRLSWGTFTP
jgi:hypothetical protein